MDVIERIKKIKQYLGDEEEDISENAKENKVKQQNKRICIDRNNTPSKNNTSKQIKTPNKSKMINKSSQAKSKTPSKNKIQNQNKTLKQNKIASKSQIIQNKKKIKFNDEPRTISEVNEEMESNEDMINMNEIKEMQQRLQSHLVNLTKIIIKNQSIKTISQELSSDSKKRSPISKDRPKRDEEVIKRKKDQKTQIEKTKRIESLPSNVDDSIPLPIDFSNQRIYSSSSSFLLHERDFPRNYRSNSNSTFNLEQFMNSNATHSILKKSNQSNETNSNFNSKPDLKTSDLNSISSLIEDAKKTRHSKRTHFSGEDDRIPGETLFISSENNGVITENSIESDILAIPLIPETYSGDNEINNQGDFITFSFSSDNANVEDNDYQDVEITEELKARYLDQPEYTKTASFSALESPILKVSKDFGFGEDIDINNLYDIGSDEGYQASFDDY